MYDEGAFCYDYALPAQALGHAHYIAWQSKTIDTHAYVPPPPRCLPPFLRLDLLASSAQIVLLLLLLRVLSHLDGSYRAMQKVAFTDGFHSREIRASGQMVADLIEKRLEGWKA